MFVVTAVTVTGQRDDHGDGGIIGVDDRGEYDGGGDCSDGSTSGVMTTVTLALLAMMTTSTAMVSVTAVMVPCRRC